MLEINIQYLKSCNELIKHLIILRLILKDTVKIEKILELEIEKSKQKEINELKALKENIFIMTLTNKYLGKSSYDIDEEKIDLIKQAEKKIDKIEELKENVMGESKAGKMLQDSEYERIEIIATIVDKVKNIKKYLILVLRIKTNKYLIIISRYICLIILFLYLLCICIF